LNSSEVRARGPQAVVHGRFDAQSGTLHIQVQGRFDFESMRAFREAYDGEFPSLRNVTVNLSAVEYMDSSALGMLLVLKKRADAQRAGVTLVGANGSVSRTLEICKFDTMFDVI